MIHGEMSRMRENPGRVRNCIDNSFYHIGRRREPTPTTFPPTAEEIGFRGEPG